MRKYRKTLTIPTIDLNDRPEQPLVITPDPDSKSADLIRLDLFYSHDRELHVLSDGQLEPAESLTSEELEQKAYLRFEHVLAEIRDQNLKSQLSRGLFLVATGPYVASEIASLCYLKGYYGHRDPCIIAFYDREQLEDFRSYDESVGLRTAQILEIPGKLDEQTLGSVSPSADLVVVPASGIVDDQGKVMSFIQSSDRRFIVAVDRTTDREIGKRV